MEKKSILANAVHLLKSRGFEHIHADIDDCQKPTKLTKRGSNQAFIPDLTAEQNDGKYYFEIVKTAKRDKSELIDKWSLLSAVAKYKNGRFFLLVPSGKLNYAQKILKEQKIEASIMRI